MASEWCWHTWIETKWGYYCSRCGDPRRWFAYWKGNGGTSL